MNIYRLSQDYNNGYETYDSCVVYAENETLARMIHPNDAERNWDGRSGSAYSDWCNPDKVDVELIGSTDTEVNPRVICASFNAG